MSYLQQARENSFDAYAFVHDMDEKYDSKIRELKRQYSVTVMDILEKKNKYTMVYSSGKKLPLSLTGVTLDYSSVDAKGTPEKQYVYYHVKNNMYQNKDSSFVITSVGEPLKDVLQKICMKEFAKALVPVAGRSKTREK